MNRTIRWLSSLLFPNRCYLCGEVICWQDRLCVSCLRKVPYILPPVCTDCGRSKKDCTCHNLKHLYERCVAPLYYTEKYKLPIYNLKTHGYRQTVDALAEEMAEVIRREYGGVSFDVVVPVPLHCNELSARGFNQSKLLAAAVSSYIGVPMADVLVKLYPTKAQKELNYYQRKGNLLGAFDVTDENAVRDAVVLLVDDVTTTGSTLDECAKMLKLYGAREVHTVTVAVSFLDRSQGEGELK